MTPGFTTNWRRNKNELAPRNVDRFVAGWRIDQQTPIENAKGFMSSGAPGRRQRPKHRDQSRGRNAAVLPLGSMTRLKTSDESCRYGWPTAENHDFPASGRF